MWVAWGLAILCPSSLEGTRLSCWWLLVRASLLSPPRAASCLSGHSYLAVTCAGVQVGKGRAALLPRACWAGPGGRVARTGEGKGTGAAHARGLEAGAGGPKADVGLISLSPRDQPPRPRRPGTFPDQSPWPLGWGRGLGAV